MCIRDRATHVIAKNEIKHLQINDKRVEGKIDKMDEKIDILNKLFYDHLIQHK